MQGNPVKANGSTLPIVGLLCCLIPALSGCSLLSSVGLLPGDEPPPAVAATYALTLTLEADAQLNPNLNGSPAPLRVRVFVVESSSELDTRSFEEMFDYGDFEIDPRPVASVTLRPGQVQSLAFTPQRSQTRLLVAAAWRDPYQSVWLADAEAEPSVRTQFVARFRDQRVTLGTQP